MGDDYLTEDEVREMLRAMIGYNFSQTDMADNLGMSPQMVCNVLAGRRYPSQPFLDLLGLRRVVRYVKADTAPDQ